MKWEDYEPTIPTTGSQTTGSLFVSLYLVILAFFILLNSIAIIEKDLIQKALGSVRNTFAKIEHNAYIPEIKLDNTTGGEISLRNYLAPIGKVAKQAITLVNTDVIESDNQIELRIPVSTFFLEESARTRSEQEDFLRKLAVELQKIESETSINIELLLGSPLPTDIPTATNNIAIARLGALSRKLSSLGVYSDNIYAGIMVDEDPEMLILRFYERDVIVPPQALPEKAAPSPTTIEAAPAS